MKKILTALLFAAISFTASAQKPTKLFNGKNLNGWSLITKAMDDIPEVEYTASKGIIDLSGKYGYIYTHEAYSNYKLTVEWRWVGEGTNSGVFINMQGENKAWPNSYEMQLAHGKAGAIIHSGGSTSAHTEAGGKSNKPGLNNGLEKEIGEWNQMEVICKENSIEVYVNGTKQNEITGLSNKSGHIGLQSEGKAIQFRNVLIESL